MTALDIFGSHSVFQVSSHSPALNVSFIMGYRLTIENRGSNSSLAPLHLERSLVVQLPHLFLSKGLLAANLLGICQTLLEGSAVIRFALAAKNCVLRSKDWSSEVIALPGVVTSLWLKGNKGGAGKTRRSEASCWL